jgi:putative ABC transport system permease protein
MKLYHIALNNLRRRKAKMFFVILGLVIGIATMVSTSGLVEAMKVEMTRQMSEFGANMVIVPDAGELSFSYGGIVVPQLLVDLEQLTVEDVAAIKSLPAYSMVRVMSPRLLGTVASGDNKVIIAGGDPQSEFRIKPWLRLQSEDRKKVEIEDMGDKGEMSYERLNLDREDLSGLELSDSEVIIGFSAALMLGVSSGDTLNIGGGDFQVYALLEENGSQEDDQVLMNLSAAQKLLERPEEVTVIEIAADYSQGSEEVLLAQLKSTLPHAKVTSLRQAVLGRDELLTRLDRFGTSVSLLTLFAALLVVALTMSAAINERTREIGIFRAIGFRKSHVTRIILLEGVLVSFIGGVIGFILGTLLARLAGPSLLQMNLVVPWRLDFLLISLVVAILIGTLASIYPAHRAAKLDPDQTLRYF